MESSMAARKCAKTFDYAVTATDVTRARIYLFIIDVTAAHTTNVLKFKKLIIMYIRKNVVVPWEKSYTYCEIQSITLFRRHGSAG